MNIVLWYLNNYDHNNSMFSDNFVKTKHGHTSRRANTIGYKPTNITSECKTLFGASLSEKWNAITRE